MKKGFIQIYTGSGKGKTTSALGLVCRASGHNFKICYVYFHKNPKKFGYGEINTLKKLKVDVFGFAKEHPHFNKKINIETIKNECNKAVEFIKEIYKENKYDILVLDEILISVRDGFLPENKLIELMKRKPENLELIITGRNASKKIIDLADLVSEINEIKHPYKKGIKSRKGIEF